MGIIALVAIGGIGFLTFVIYATVKTKSTSLNKYEPFKEWVGKTVSLNKNTVLFKEKIRMNDNGNYPYVLLDDMHPKWQYVDELKIVGDLEEIARFPVGTMIKFDKAIQYTNGVSGSSYPTIFGTITANGQEYKTGYQWGERDLEQVEKCWQFHKAPWQEEQDTSFYSLPTATLW